MHGVGYVKMAIGIFEKNEKTKVLRPRPNWLGKKIFQLSYALTVTHSCTLVLRRSKSVTKPVNMRKLENFFNNLSLG